MGGARVVVPRKYRSADVQQLLTLAVRARFGTEARAISHGQREHLHRTGYRVHGRAARTSSAQESALCAAESVSRNEVQSRWHYGRRNANMRGDGETMP
jgi:hypothetical protein